MASGLAALLTLASSSSPRKRSRSQTAERTGAECSPIPAVKSSASTPPSAVVIVPTAVSRSSLKLMDLVECLVEHSGQGLMYGLGLVAGTTRGRHPQPSRKAMSSRSGIRASTVGLGDSRLDP